MTTLIIAIIVAGLALYVIILYNRLIKSRQMVEEGWSGIDVQLKRRTNLIPNLVSSVKGYIKHERGVLEEVTSLRAQAERADDKAPEERGRIESALTGALGRLQVVMENYPELKANENVLSLQESLDEIENQIQMARRYYNGAVRNNNILVGSFPSNLVANAFSFEQAEYFEIEEDRDRAVPQVEL